jgi:hypothetical protein
LASNNIALAEDICPALTDIGAIIEKKIASSTVIDIFILAGMLFHPNTGTTMKNAEILVSTIVKPNSFSIISSIYLGSQTHEYCVWGSGSSSVPHCLNLAEYLVGEFENDSQHPAAANQYDNPDSQKLRDYCQGHIADGSNRLKQGNYQAHNHTRQ